MSAPTWGAALRAVGVAMLTTRRREILNFIVGQYVVQAVPVSSHAVAKSSALRVSPATARNEMAELADDGFIHRPHISAGSVPLDKGYRSYVEALPDDPELPAGDAANARHSLSGASDDVEHWADAAAETLAGLIGNMALVTPPKAAQGKIRRLELVRLQEFAVMLILVLQAAKTRQRIVPMTQMTTQDDLNELSNRLSAIYSGATYHGVDAAPRFGPVERRVLGVVKDLLLEEELDRIEEPCVAGLRNLVGQPEFAEDGARAGTVIGLLENRQLLREMLSAAIDWSEWRIVIGGENEAEEMHDCGVVLSRYGDPEGIGGVVAALGPKRMDYRRSMASVRLVSTVMGDMVAGLD